VLFEQHDRVTAQQAGFFNPAVSARIISCASPGWYTSTAT
jgi:hypothetical protein